MTALQAAGSQGNGLLVRLRGAGKGAAPTAGTGAPQCLPPRHPVNMGNDHISRDQNGEWAACLRLLDCTGPRSEGEQEGRGDVRMLSWNPSNA